VIATPTTEPEQLREPLARAVERSGLFYEAHQARWLRGDYPVERLREEPQAAISKQNQPTNHDDASAAPANTSQPLVVRGHPQAQSGAETLPDFRASETTPSASTSLTPDKRTSDPIAQELLPIVRQQLDTLETRHMSWHGEVWPGQFMQWEIAADEHAAGHSDDQRDWQTRLALSLPALGEIGAALSFSTEGISIALSARDSAAANAMQGASHELRRALEAAGLNVVTVQVRQREPTV